MPDLGNRGGCGADKHGVNGADLAIALGFGIGR